jgi:hypothetical protein
VFSCYCCVLAFGLFANFSHFSVFEISFVVAEEASWFATSAWRRERRKEIWATLCQVIFLSRFFFGFVPISFIVPLNHFLPKDKVRF